jgi:hypothetical protein
MARAFRKRDARDLVWIGLRVWAAIVHAKNSHRDPEAVAEHPGAAKLLRW